MKVFDAFERIRIVNLAHRTDRRAEMDEQLRRVGLQDDPRVAFFEAVQGQTEGLFYSKGAYGVFLSQRTILDEAAVAGQSVLILEDDCDFLPGAADFELNAGVDVFYGGYHASDPQNLHNSPIIGAHFMGFSARAAKAASAYLADYLNEDFPPDPESAREPDYNPNKRPGVDGAYVWFRRAHPDLKTQFAQIGVQRPSRTDIGRTAWFDRVPVVRNLAGAARRLRRVLGKRHGFKADHLEFGRGGDR